MRLESKQASHEASSWRRQRTCSCNCPGCRLGRRGAARPTAGATPRRATRTRPTAGKKPVQRHRTQRAKARRDGPRRRNAHVPDSAKTCSNFENLRNRPAGSLPAYGEASDPSSGREPPRASKTRDGLRPRTSTINLRPSPPRGGGAARPPVRGRAQESAPAPQGGAGRSGPP